MPELKPYRIQIEGKKDTGPWKIIRVDNNTTYEERSADRFGQLCFHLIRLVQSRPNEYGLNYIAPHGLLFEETEEKVLRYILDVHNLAIRRGGLEAIIP